MAGGIVKSCAHCGKAFNLTHNGQKYCGDHCRFWCKVQVTGPGDCWLWLGTKPAFGHGQFRLDGRAVYSHRVSWEELHGPVSDDLCVLHKCDVPACVNPAHLFVGTREENLADMRRKGRGSNPPRKVGTSHHGAKLTESDVRFIRKSPEKRSVLAARFGVQWRAIWSIQNGRTWTHIK